jgi:Leucine-rich repeat (LRR) protein
LNLNFNALRDLKPLQGIKRLKRLHIAGNRLARLRKMTSILSQFSFLSATDLRGNPLTLGFYPPLLDTTLAVRKVGDGGDAVEPFTIGKVDNGRDAKYAGCLDKETRMMRRVYELLVLGSCPWLRTLDGLEVDRSTMDLRDETWDTLMEAGVLSFCPSEPASSIDNEEGSSTLKQPVQEPQSLEKLDPEERWPAEDSFA